MCQRKYFVEILCLPIYCRVYKYIILLSVLQFFLKIFFLGLYYVNVSVNSDLVNINMSFFIVTVHKAQSTRIDSERTDILCSIV